MATLQENGASMFKPWVQVVIAIVIGILFYYIGANSGAGLIRDKLGDEVRRVAMAKGSDTTLVVGKKSGVNVVHIPSGNSIPTCDKRKPNQEQCKFDARILPNGKFELLDKETQQPVPRNKIFTEVHTWVHKGSFCTTSSSGGKTTTNCCHHPSCW